MKEAKADKSKFKEGDRCRVVKNLLAPHCVGQIVVINGVALSLNGRNYYHITEGGLKGIAAENCLEKLE